MAHRDGPLPEPEWDPGLARERTELAWTRTTVSLIALGAAVVKAHPMAGVSILAMGVACWIAGRRPSGPPGRSYERRRRRPLRAIAVTLTLVSLAALATTLLTAGSRAAPTGPLPTLPQPVGPTPR
ncbi:DUF202 domain-containing protein [Nonomuraea sp. K274]|uniref:DUF202 domain-containing protein n=1 Tax=Nonomuraea cypriaca TaxID=1187855 RepID=A0A931A2J4_9ACTN|nr:DUF202 domain-containing protein [Nonomuraea cypriaca]MBF8185051.1 DUF202 domain-containing protein [Nonomuraea cypriaca]